MAVPLPGEPESGRSSSIRTDRVPVHRISV